MKKLFCILLILIISFTGFSQAITDTTTLKSAINTDIAPASNITAVKLNRILQGNIVAIPKYSWGIKGAVGTNPAIHYLGTADAQPLVFKTNGTELGRISGNGNYNIQFGKDAYASGVYATAYGRKDTASGSAAFATGNTTMASGNVSTAMGEATLANGDYTMAVNHSTIATGYAGFAANEGTKATGNMTASFGYETRAKGYGSFVTGTFNDSANAADAIAYNGLNRIFQVGNGTSNSARSNALTILANGSIGVGTVSPAASSLLDISTTTKGVLFPRLNTTQQNAISSPATGLIIWNTDSLALCSYSGSAWGKIVGAGGGGGVSTGYGLSGTSTVILDTSVAVNKAGNQVISGVKTFTNDMNFLTDKQITFNPTTNSSTFLQINNPTTASYAGEIPYKFRMGSAPNPGGTYNTIMADGFNINGIDDPTQPSMHRAMELRCMPAGVTWFAEYHNPQLEMGTTIAHPTREVSRLQSYTAILRDSLGNSNVNLALRQTSIDFMTLKGAVFGGLASNIATSDWQANFNAPNNTSGIKFTGNGTDPYTYVQSTPSNQQLIFTNWSAMHLPDTVISGQITGITPSNGLGLSDPVNVVRTGVNGSAMELNFLYSPGNVTAKIRADGGSGEVQLYSRSGGYFWTMYNNGLQVLKSVAGGLELGLSGGSNGTLKMVGSTSGTATIVAPATAGTPTLTLPIATGTIPSMTFGTAAPATTPAASGLYFLDTTNKKLYVSTGTASSADWTILN